MIVLDINYKIPFSPSSFNLENIGARPQHCESTYIQWLSVSLHVYMSNSSQNNDKNEQNIKILTFCYYFMACCYGGVAGC